MRCDFCSTLKALAGLSVRDSTHKKQVLGDSYRNYVLQQQAGTAEQIKTRLIAAGKGALVQFVFRCTEATMRSKVARQNSDGQEKPHTPMRRMAIAILSSLLVTDAQKMAMIDIGALPRFVQLLQGRDAMIRRGAAEALATVAKLGWAVPAKYHAMICRAETLGPVVGCLESKHSSSDGKLISLTIGIVQNCLLYAPQESPKARLRLRMLKLGLIDTLFGHAEHLTNASKKDYCADNAEHGRSSGAALYTAASDAGTTDEQRRLLQQISTTLVDLLQTKIVLREFCGLKGGYMQSLLELSRTNDTKTCRNCLRLLARVATIKEAKQQLLSHPMNLPLLMSLAERSVSLSVARAVARILAELAEAWHNRAPLVMGGVLRTLSILIGRSEDKDLTNNSSGTDTSQAATRFEAARCLADLAEVPELRAEIARACTKDLCVMLPSTLSGVTEQTIR